MKNSIVFIIFLLFFKLTIANNNNKPLKIFLIPHSHDDGGWLNTYNEYFDGTVQRILTSVVNELNKDPEKKFNWVEIGFFSEWYNTQNKNIKDIVKKLIDNKQLGFITGGLIQNDEATANIDDIIEQMTQGHLWLKNNLNYTVEYAWQIDPFGYSSNTPTIFKNMGIKGLVINRVSNNVKSYMKDKNTMEFIWKGSDTLESDSELIVSTLDDHYDYPKMIDPLKSKLKIKDKVDKFVDYLKNLSNTRNTNVLIIPLGDDFRYQDAEKEFRLTNEWLEIIQSNKEKYNIESIKYSLLSEYFEELNKELIENKKQLFLFDKDFFPYNTGKNEVWSGYFTTRPVLKKQIRDSSNLLRNSEIIYTFAKALELNNSKQLLQFETHLNDNRNTISLSQHHDIVTGTSRSYVLYDNFKKLQESSIKSYNIISNSIESLLNKNKDTINNNNNNELFKVENSINVMNLKDQEFYSLIFQNSLGWVTKQHISIRILSTKNKLKNLEFFEAETNKKQLIQVIPIKPFLNDDNEIQEFNLISIININPLGLNSYLLRLNETQNDENILSKIVKLEDSNDIIFENRKLKIKFNSQGYLASISNKKTGKTKSFNQSFNQYTSKNGGAYIFNDGKKEGFLKKPDQIYLYEGPLLSQLNLLFGVDKQNNISSIVVQKIYKSGLSSEEILSTENYLETGYSFKGQDNKEKVINYKIDDFNSKNVFYTDNGFETRTRFYDSNLKKPDNYYPTLHLTKIKDTNVDEQLTIYVDRSVGVTSQENGELEIMLHRTKTKDDSKGLGWPSRDESRIDGKLYLNFDSIEQIQDNEKKISLQIDHSPIFMIKKFTNQTNYLENYKTSFSPVFKPLPNNLHLMSLKTYSKDKIGLRLFNFYKQNQQLNINQFFNNDLKINYLNQTNLSFLKNIKDSNIQESNLLKQNDYLNYMSKQVKFDDNFPIKSGKSEFKFIKNTNNNLQINDSLNIQHNINPLEIKSFILEFKDINNAIDDKQNITNNSLNNKNIKVQKIANYLVIDKRIEENRYTYDFSIYPINLDHYNDRGSYQSNLKTILILSISIPVVVLCLIILGIVIYKKKKQRNHQRNQQNNTDEERIEKIEKIEKIENMENIENIENIENTEKNSKERKE